MIIRPPSGSGGGDAEQKIVTHRFAYRVLIANLDVDLFDNAGIVQGVEAQRNGYLVGICAQAADSITAGTIQVKPTIEGAIIPAGDLDLVLNSTQQTAQADISRSSDFAVDANEKIGVKAISSILLAPETDLLVILYFLIYP